MEGEAGHFPSFTCARPVMKATVVAILMRKTSSSASYPVVVAALVVVVAFPSSAAKTVDMTGAAVVVVVAFISTAGITDRPAFQASVSWATMAPVIKLTTATVPAHTVSSVRGRYWGFVLSLSLSLSLPLSLSLSLSLLAVNNRWR